jgi:hypothetical protein
MDLSSPHDGEITPIFDVGDPRRTAKFARLKSLHMRN